MLIHESLAYPGRTLEKIIVRLRSDSSPVIVSCFRFLSRWFPRQDFHFRARERSERNNLFENQSWQRVAYISNVHSYSSHSSYRRKDVIFLVSCLVENLISQLSLALCFIYDLDMLIRTFLQVFTIRLGVIFHISFLCLGKNLAKTGGVSAACWFYLLLPFSQVSSVPIAPVEFSLATPLCL